ncbi:uncharacterized protein LOC134540617 [Bacillus rossius redtenbacheri]|uniref:uncharacterized protein LOC134540617 n=1 Tax=Bacillus rossius redtenbacheri TaxID=93214 RepID=UPI002FDE1DCD
MMRELGTVSPVVWPAWCYSGEGQTDSEATPAATDPPGQQATAPSPTPKTPRGKRRAGPGGGHGASSAAPNGSDAHHHHHNNNNSVVKSERLSPAGPAAPDTPGGGSSSSRSATPGSCSYPGTPPAAACAAPASPGGRPGAEQLVSRNYSDFMRSLAAKYNNANPNDYFSAPARNGFPVSLDPRFAPFKQESPSASATAASPFAGLLHKPASSKDAAPDKAAAAAEAAQHLYAPLFPPLIDMSSTQALLNMVRTANAHSAAASQLESYLKVSSAKRGGEGSSSSASGSPLDLSAAAPAKRPRGGKALPEALRDPPPARRRYGSVSPKPLRAAPGARARTLPCLSLCADSQATASWNVDDVCNFVGAIDICAEYVPNFREQRIDGSALPLLTEDHLTTTLGMKLGPALKLKATLARRLGHCAVCQHCVHCHSAAPPPPPPSPAAAAAAALGRPSSTGN